MPTHRSMPRPSALSPSRAVQPSLADLGTPLSAVTFVVVDLETTGGAPGATSITEIGAVRVRGGVVEGEMTTLVNPGVAVPPQITVLTGITNAMLVNAPPVSAALSSFLQWAGLDRPDTVLVAHNARFDVGHLRGAARALGLGWSEPQVLDTLAMARLAWKRPQVPNHRLATLASFVGAQTSPTHRALDDARATVDVLHAALEALAPLGITHVEDLRTISDPVPASRRAKSRLAQGLPTGPGVYQFTSPTGEVLYVGSAVNIQRRVRSYFTAAETRRSVAHMLDTAVEVRTIETPTEIEARVRELRLIAALDPPVNRRSRSPRRRPWMYLHSGPPAHLATTTVLPTDKVGSAVGPFPSRSAAAEAMRAAESVLRLRSWDGRGAGELTATQRPSEPGRAERALAGEIDVVARPVLERIRDLAAQQRYEEAGTWTHRLRCLILACQKAEKARPLLLCPALVAARRRREGGWELIEVRWGRLACSAVTPPGADPRPAVVSLRSAAQVVDRPQTVGAGASIEETLLLADWALDEGSRLVEVDGGEEVLEALTWPVGAAWRHHKVVASA